MPGLISETPYQHITVKELAPTFVAEVQGVDFSKPIEPEVFQEIKDALAKVCLANYLSRISPDKIYSTASACSVTQDWMILGMSSSQNCLETWMTSSRTSPMAGSLASHTMSCLMLVT